MSLSHPCVLYGICYFLYTIARVPSCTARMFVLFSIHLSAYAVKVWRFGRQSFSSTGIMSVHAGLCKECLKEQDIWGVHVHCLLDIVTHSVNGPTNLVLLMMYCLLYNIYSY